MQENLSNMESDYSVPVITEPEQKIVVISPVGAGPRGGNLTWAAMTEREKSDLVSIVYNKLNIVAESVFEDAVVTSTANMSSFDVPFQAYDSSADMLFVFINGLMLAHGTDYTVSNSHVNLVTPIATAGEQIYVRKLTMIQDVSPDAVIESDIADVVREDDITDVVREDDITDVVRTSDITDVVREDDITDVVRTSDITDVVRTSTLNAMITVVETTMELELGNDEEHTSSASVTIPSGYLPIGVIVEPISSDYVLAGTAIRVINGSYMVFVTTAASSQTTIASNQSVKVVCIKNTSSS